MGARVVIGAAGRADAGAFLARLLRLDPAAVVRLRPAKLYPAAAGRAEMWAMLPFGVLVVRLVARAGPAVDLTVGAKDLLDSLSAPEGFSDPAAPMRRRDEAWRWPLPSSLGRAVEVIPEAEIGRVAVAASHTLRQATAEGLGGRRVGERVMRDALLDHVPIVVTSTAGDRVAVPQRLVQAVARMAFLHISSTSVITEGETSVTVRWAGGWIGLDCSYGSAWYLPVSPLRLS